jgi:hypothetical protein
MKSVIGKPRYRWEEEEDTKWTRKKEHTRTWNGFITISGQFLLKWQRMTDLEFMAQVTALSRAIFQTLR